MNKLLFLVTKILAVLVLSVFISGLSGCEETYENTGNTDVVDPTDTTDPTDPTDSTEQADPTEPAEPTDTTDPTEPTEPTDPTEPAEPTEPTEPTEPEDPCLAPDAEKINSVIIGTYNTHLFFDKVCDTGHCSSSDFESVLSDSEYNTKVKDLADSVKKIGADISLLQEVEKDSCLQDLFGKTGTYEDCFLGEKETVDTAVMTKGKITYKNKHPEQIECAGCDGGKTTFSRAFLETHIELGCRKIIVFSAHFKSKADDDAQRRLAEAAAAAKILKKRAEENPGALIVMGGDLNDEPGSDTLKSFENDSAFLRVAAELSSKDQATYYYRGDAIALDHIFLVKTDGGKYKTGSAEVVKDAPSYYSLGSSDHAALKATFEF